MIRKYKLFILVILSVFLLTACQSDSLDKQYETMDKILNSYESGFKSTINVGEDSYFLEGDILGNLHIIETVSNERIEIYLISEKYYICSDICEVMNKENVEKIYGDKYSVSVLQTVIDNALQYHKDQYSYILSLKEKDVVYDIATDEQNVTTIVYPTTDEERQIVIVDPQNSIIKYNYNGEEENDVVFELTPELQLESPVDVE